MKNIIQQFIVSAFFLLGLVANGHADDTVVLQLKWRHQFQFAGYYAALEKGFYRDVGLNVELRESNPDLDVVEEVINGNADYGIGGSELIIYRSKDKPVIVVAAIFQKSADVILTKRSSGINTPQEAAKEPIMISPKAIDGAAIRAMFLKEGIDPDKLQYMDHTWTVDDLILDKTKVFTAYITDQPFHLIKKKIPYFTIQPQDYGVDFYGDSLFTSRDELENNPKRLAKFREASLKGWKYALENSNEVIDLIIKKYSTDRSHLDREHLKFEAEETKKLIFADIVAVGHVNPGRWQQIGKTYWQLGFTDTQVDLDHFLYNPNPTTKLSDYFWIIVATLGTVILVTMVALVLFRLNKRLQHEVDNHHKTSRFLNEIYNNADAGFFVVDVIDEQKYIYAGANPSHLKIIGNIPIEKIIGKMPDELTDFFPPIAIGLINEIYTQCVRERIPIIRENPVIIDGESTWWMSRISPLIDKENRVYRLIGTSLPITELKKAQEQAAQVALEWQTTFDSTNDTIWILDKQQRIIRSNRTAEIMFKLSPQDMIGKHCCEVLHGTTDRFTSCPTAELKNSLKRQTTELQISGQWYQITADPILDKDDSFQGVVHIISDITERKKTEEALHKRENDLRLTLDSTTDGIWTWDVQSGEVFFSDKYYTMLGFEPGEFPASYESWSSLLHPEDRDSIQKVSNEKLFVEKEGYDIEFRLKTKKGDYLWIRGRAKITDWDETGTPSYVIGNHENITKRKAAEALIKSNLNEKEILLQEIHHRVKNNMQVVASLLSLQSQKVKDKTVKEALRESRNRIYAMSTVHELLHESKDLSQISLKPFLTKIANSLVLSYSVNQGKIQLKIEVADVSIGIYQASPLCLTINELVSNSIKYAFPNTGEGELLIALKQKEARVIQMTIADNGVGLPDELDWQNPESLGLHLVKVLVEDQLDGSIELDSSSGTKFTIEFDLA